MAFSRLSRVIQMAYERKYNLDTNEISHRRINYPSRFYPLLAAARSNRVMLTGILTVLVLTAGTIYYYNLLVTTQQDVNASQGKIHALLQRRNDISINLSIAVMDYARHEQAVFTAITELRSLIAKEPPRNAELKQPMAAASGETAGTAALSASDPKAAAEKTAAGLKAAGKTALIAPVSEILGFTPDPASPIAGLMAVAEQYPDLKLSATFQSLMTALIEIEKDLADKRIEFNDAVNIYSTNRMHFPTNVFAVLFGFDDVPYYTATEDAIKLKPIEF